MSRAPGGLYVSRSQWVAPRLTRLWRPAMQGVTRNGCAYVPQLNRIAMLRASASQCAAWLAVAAYLCVCTCAHILSPSATPVPAEVSQESTVDTQWLQPPMCNEQPPARRSTSRTYHEIMALPSRFRPFSQSSTHTHARARADDEFAYTVVMSVYNRPQNLPRLLTALLTQTHPPWEIWLLCMASPVLPEYVDVLSRMSTHAVTHTNASGQAAHQQRLDSLHEPDGMRINGTRVRFISGDVQMWYYARWLVAQQVRTAHVYILDDDMIPGVRAVASAMHMMYTENREYYGMVVLSGHRSPVEAPQTHRQHSFVVHWATAPWKSEVVDVGAVGLVRTEWIRHMFADAPLVLETADDMQVVAMLQKYAGISAHVAPVDMHDPDTWLLSADAFELSKQNATTENQPEPMFKRIAVSWQLFVRGRFMHRSHELWGESHSRANVLALVSGQHAAATWSGWWRRVFGDVPSEPDETDCLLCRYTRGMVAVAPERTGPRDMLRELNEVAARLGTTWQFSARRVGMWLVDADVEVDPGASQWLYRALHSLQQILTSVRPAVLLVDSVAEISHRSTRSADNKTNIVQLVYVAAVVERIPVIDVARCNGPNIDHAACISSLVSTRLCACQRDNSEGGAYAWCPDLGAPPDPSKNMWRRPSIIEARDFGRQQIPEHMIDDLR